MGKKSAPPAPDYTAVAQQQAAASKDLNQQQTWDNRPNLTTPWGSQTWNAKSTIDPTTGKPVNNWESTITLSPDQQAALDSQSRVQTGRSQGAEQLLGQAVENFQNPMDWGALPQGASSVQGGPLQRSLGLQRQMNGTAGDWRQRAQDAVTELQAPGLANSREVTESQLANQGITRGSEAWNNAQRDIGDNENRARLAAIAAGRDEANMLFGQDLQGSQFANNAALQEGQFGNTAATQDLNNQINAGGFNNTNRQQAISEGQLQRSQTLNELNALLTGQQVQNPNMPSFSPAGKGATPDLMGAATNQYQAGLDASNAQQAGLGGAMNGLFSLGSSALGAGGWGGLFALSDIRLKRDIKYLFTLANNIRVYQFRMMGNDHLQIGVLAQEVKEIMPDAVKLDEHGYYRVNYDMVLA